MAEEEMSRDYYGFYDPDFDVPEPKKMDKPLYYLLVPYRESDRAKEFMATAAILNCEGCGEMIDGMGGPGGAICVECRERIREGLPR